MSAQRKARRDGFRDTSRDIARRITGTGSVSEQLARWVGAITILGILGGALLFFVLYFLIDLPDPNRDFESQRTDVYYSDGQHKIGSFAVQERESVPLSDVSEPMQAAVIAAEDRTFYKNRGIDIRGIIRAARNNASSGEITGGGSTITQQYVKVLYLSQERSYTRKVREAILSIKIHNRLSKQEILQGYLNLVYFGQGAYGVEVASQTYFDKPSAQLDYREAAVMAAAINQPSAFDPYTKEGRDAIMPRYNYVLSGMEEAGAISSSQAAEARDNLPKFAPRKAINRYEGPKGHVLRFVQEQMQKLGYSDSDILGGGYDVVTTISYERQKAAEQAMATVPPKGLDELHTALVSIAPGDGAVRAIYGGPDYLKNQVDWATVGTQPGSTFKAFAIIAALEDGFSLKSKLNGSSPLHVGEGPYAANIENQGDSGGKSFGNVSLARAAQKSINTAFVDLTIQMAGGRKADVSIGAKKILEAANQAGIPKAYTDKIDPVATTPLGYAPIPPIEMANAYATIAAGGLHADWYVIDHIVAPTGARVYQHKVKTEQTIPADVAGDTIVAMRGVVDGGTGVRAKTVCPTAGKTGTATAGDNDNQHVSSSWFVGYTPKAATAVMYNRGVGNEDLEGYLNPFFGGTYPAMTFKAFMTPTLNRADCGQFVPPGNIVNTKGSLEKDNSDSDDSDSDSD
ncbi:MAG TPA: transglycosylase domain-containing protein [Aeromicrobium sp.]|nr:transglycosylase domain-containing protein [Aeromicrobium sp.]